MPENTDAAAAPPGDDSSAEQYSPAYANYVLGVLFIVYVFNFIDRQVMSVFIGPIKEEFGASDTQMGLLVGFAFALLYTFAGIPIARWADRGNRRSIIAIGLTVWSAMTVVSGLARNFVQLAIARVLVGIGEAAGSPPSHSLIADYFSLDRRGTALAIYTAGAFVGSAVAYLFGGYLREYFDWRTAFIVLGAPGLLIALVVRFTVREPPRGMSDRRTETAPDTSTLKESLAFLVSSPSWVYLMAGFSLVSITNYAVLMWGFEFFGRVHEMSPITIGNWMGLIVGVGGSVGTIFGGRLVDWLAAVPARALRVPVLVTLAGFPLGIYSLLTESQSLALWCFAPFYLLLNVYIPAMYSHNQNLARLRMRATAAAVMLFLVNIVGAGVGPLIVGALSDLFAPAYGIDSIRYALVGSLVIGAVGTLFLLWSGRTLAADLARTQELDS